MQDSDLLQCILSRGFPQDMMVPDLPLWPRGGDFVVGDGESNTWLLMLGKWERKLGRNENSCWLLRKRFRHCLNSFLKATFSLGWVVGGWQRVDLNADLPKGRGWGCRSGGSMWMALANLQWCFTALSSACAQITVVSKMYIYCMCMHSIGDNQLGYTCAPQSLGWKSVKKFWGQNHIYKSSNGGNRLKKEGVCIWKCICILKATAEAAPLVLCSQIQLETQRVQQGSGRERGCSPLPGAVHIPCSWTPAQQ